MSAEYLSNELGNLLRRHFVDDAKPVTAALDDPNGPLGTFSSRIEFAYLLGLIGPAARRELNLIRKIRNDFAHDYKPLDFSADAIATRCGELRAHTLVPAARPRAKFTRSVMGLLAIIHAATYSVEHAEAGSDFMSRLSPEQIQRLGDDAKKMAELMMAAVELKDSDERE